MTSILIKPLITEKLNLLKERRDQYGFIVDRRASKEEIISAIEKLYGVEVDWLNTMVAPTKKRKNNRTGQVTGRTNSYKKAIFKLKDGHKIDFFENN
ncbi:MAG: 50S ribosomal protein L23 [Bacteroidia bacterium]|nr:50S ribosomal protein L23 [Bacteroidia bacterium]